MDLTASVHQICANLRKSALKTLAMIRQAFKIENMSHTQMFDMLTSGQIKKSETGEEQSQEHANNFL
jgi:hypothetical protein